jgi:hypothetical protein
MSTLTLTQTVTGERMRARRVGAGLTAALVVLATLAACTPPTTNRTAPPPAVPAAVESAESEPEPVVLDPGVTVATGELSSVDGLSSGRVSVVSVDGGDFELVIDDFVTPLAEMVVNLSTEPFTEEGYCAAAQIIYVFGAQPTATRVVVPMAFGDLDVMDDPSFLDTLLLTVNSNDVPRTGCFYPVFASTDLAWTISDLRPDIDVVDSGPTGGATGPVEMHGDTIGGYTVAAGDVLAEIAARFGLTSEDLLYLSPGRIADGNPATAFVDEEFNLDKATR